MAGSVGAGGPERRPSQLSHGNQQRVQLVAALIHRPRLAVLDEPFTGIDPLGVETMSRNLLDVAAAGTGVLFSSHQPDLVEDVCQDAVVIERGRVVLSGELESLRRSSPIRHIEVTVDDRPWSGAMFLDHEAGRPARGGRRVDLDAVVKAASADGPITRLVFQPPGLADLFREAVNR